MWDYIQDLQYMKFPHWKGLPRCWQNYLPRVDVADFAALKDVAPYFAPNFASGVPDSAVRVKFQVRHDLKFGSRQKF